MRIGIAFHARVLLRLTECDFLRCSLFLACHMPCLSHLRDVDTRP